MDLKSVELSDTPLQTILHMLASQVKEGNTGLELDSQAHNLIRGLGCEPAFLGYRGFPNVLCVSVNDQVIHGIPSRRKFEDGDVVKLDLGLVEEGVYDDGAVTVIVGKGSALARRLIDVAKEALRAGISAAKAGNTTHHIGDAIHKTVRRKGFSVVKGYGGHGIGDALHLPPDVPNEVSGTAVTLMSGMRIAIEPMLSSKSGEVFIDEDGWTVRLTGGGLAAHFERTIVI